MTVSTALWILGRAIDRQRRAVLGLALEEGFDPYEMQRQLDRLGALHRGYNALLTALAVVCIDGPRLRPTQRTLSTTTSITTPTWR